MIGCAVGSVLLVVAVGNGLVDRYRPDAADREYVARLGMLRAAQEREPGRPLLLVIGSSRTVMGFLPEQLPPLPGRDGVLALPFNFSHFGAGPVMNRIVAGRLVRDGVRPRWVVLELMPGFFPRENCRLVASLCTADDLPEGGRYFKPGELAWEWFRHRSTGFPAFAHRAVREPGAVTSYGWLGGYGLLKESATPAERASEMAGQAGHFGWKMRDWKASPRADAALRDTVALLRANGATVHLVITPEGADHAAMYGPGCRDRVTVHLTALAAELGLPLTDAREWLDESDFTDSHHALKHGAEKFTRRLGREVLAPLVAGDE